MVDWRMLLSQTCYLLCHIQVLFLHQKDPNERSQTHHHVRWQQLQIIHSTGHYGSRCCFREYHWGHHQHNWLEASHFFWHAWLDAALPWPHWPVAHHHLHHWYLRYHSTLQHSYPQKSPYCCRTSPTPVVVVVVHKASWHLLYSLKMTLVVG